MPTKHIVIVGSAGPSWTRLLTTIAESEAGTIRVDLQDEPLHVDPPYSGYRPAFNRSARVERKLAKQAGVRGAELHEAVIWGIWYNFFRKMRRIRGEL